MDLPGGSACLGQLTAAARRWAGTSEAAAAAKQAGSIDGLRARIRALPQRDDDGTGRLAPRLRCDYPIRARENPSDPNCVERALWYLAVAEHLEPQRERAIVEVAGAGFRHVNAVERASA
ncbi:MAG TPA: hypothetical protein VE987_07740, partial [Polyangiaceae bacterium]|nr:hypothetical protein [Polyangiaceae bacterium]